MKGSNADPKFFKKNQMQDTPHTQRDTSPERDF